MEETANILPPTRAVLAIVFSYLIGSIPIGLIVARVTKGIDIREYGSGNIGLTNVIRTLGWGPGLITGLLDFLKGYLPVLYAMHNFSPQDFGGMNIIYETIVILVSASIIIGNLYPVYLLFKGGKGVATGFGVLSALMGVYIFIPLAVFGVILLIFRFVSLGSIIAAISVPLTVLFLGSKLPVISENSNSGVSITVGFTSIVAILIIWKHRTNISRIFAGTEPRVRRAKESIPSLSEKLAKQKESETKEENESGESAQPEQPDIQEEDTE
jgi:glycerol-3-phosphate acyltransferase PlsY